MKQMQQIENHRELSEKRIVVLGGSSGIGLEVAQQVVVRGARAIIASSNADRVKQAVAMLDGKAEGHTLDLSKERDIQNFFQKIGDVDHLVFTAGDTLQLNELVATDLTKARHAFELRYWAALAAVKYASPHIRKDGSIVLTTGVAGRRPHKGWTVAASICGTIEALTRALAVELALVSTRYVLASCERIFGTTCRSKIGRPCTRTWANICSWAGWGKPARLRAPIFSSCRRDTAQAKRS
jgi:NAD(P)-dependent dehydrogenase (short-subunit alcohol dehydrogenase family)